MNPLAWPAAVKIVALAVLAACIGVGAALVVGNGHAAAPNVSARLAGAGSRSTAASLASPVAAAQSPASAPSPTAGPYSGNPVSGDCLLGANGADVEVGIAEPTASCARWIQTLAGSGLVWYPITSMLPPGSQGGDDDTMEVSCDLTDGTQELYVMDGGSEYYGNSICSDEEQNGWTPEGSPGPLAALGQQLEQAAVSASAAASQASANAAAEQVAQSDISTVEGLSLASDLSALSGNVQQTDNDLGTVKSDAASGQGSYCSNVSTAGADADSVAADADSLSAGLDTLTNDISSDQRDITTVQNDLSTLQSNGLSDPPGGATAIASAQSAISQAVSAANADIATVNGYVNDAYSIANGMATGSCDGSGPGSPPSPIADISV
jgi:hypothetical protein